MSKKPSLISRIVAFFMRIGKRMLRSGILPLKVQRFLIDLPGRLSLHRGTTIERIRMQRPAGEPGPPVKAAWITPVGVDEDRVLLYLHGGGFVLGSIDSHSPLVSNLARASGCRALAVDYRLAPEHRCPEALDDCVTAYRWLLAEGYSPDRIVIAGDSAGGNLTPCTLLALRDSGEPLPAAGVMLSPATDLAITGKSTVTKAQEDPMIDMGWGRRCISTYLGSLDPRDPRYSPYYADLAGLPPLLVHLGSREVLYDDCTGFAERARRSGVEVELEVFEGMFHVFQICGMFMPESRDAIRKIGAFCRGRTGA